jgi:hypothetical protein
MFSSYDMNPIAIEQMEKEHLAAHIEYLDRKPGFRVPASFTVILILLGLIAVS